MKGSQRVKENDRSAIMGEKKPKGFLFPKNELIQAMTTQDKNILYFILASCPVLHCLLGSSKHIVWKPLLSSPEMTPGAYPVVVNGNIILPCLLGAKNEATSLTALASCSPYFSTAVLGHKSVLPYRGTLITTRLPFLTSLLFLFRFERSIYSETVPSFIFWICQFDMQKSKLIELFNISKSVQRRKMSHQASTGSINTWSWFLFVWTQVTVFALGSVWNCSPWPALGVYLGWICG